ncbi:MAG: hypothetical protein ACSW8H_00080 [bacterium]
MKAPDKIYLGIDDMGSGYVYNLSLDNNGHTEYIRKDALMEWAKERREAVAKEVVIQEGVRLEQMLHLKN